MNTDRYPHQGRGGYDPGFRDAFSGRGQASPDYSDDDLFGGEYDYRYDGVYDNRNDSCGHDVYDAPRTADPTGMRSRPADPYALRPRPADSFGTRSSATNKERVPVIFYLILSCAVLMSVLLLNSYSVSDTRSDASMGLMDSFHHRCEVISNKAFGDVLGYKMSFFIPETTVVCPKPDADCYGSSADDGVIRGVISASDLARGFDTVWHEGIEYHPGTVPEYYSDPSILTLAWKENNGVNIINFCEIFIADGSQFRRFLCDNTFGSNNQKYATTMAESLNAVVAMNGDFYSHRQAGVAVYQGKVYRNNPQFLDQCFIDVDGNMIFKREGEIGSDEQFQKFVDDNKIRFSLSFGPILVENHKAIRSIGAYSLGEVNDTFARTSIGFIGERHYLFCLVEGAKGGYKGIDILGLAAIMEQRGCEKAYTLDGGQTAELIINNKLYSRVVYEAERQVSDIIFFATAAGD